MAQPITSQQIRDASFSMTRLRTGYVMSEVDDFLENAAQRVSAGFPPLSTQHLPLFDTTWLRAGYDEKEVDTFLEILYAASGIAPPKA